MAARSGAATSTSSSSGLVPVRALLFVLVGAVAAALLMAVFVSQPSQDLQSSKRRWPMDDDAMLMSGPCPCPPCAVCPFTVLDQAEGVSKGEMRDVLGSDEDAGALLTREDEPRASTDFAETQGEEEGATQQHCTELDIRAGPAMDRMFEDTITVDMTYTMNISPSHWLPKKASYNAAMQALHGEDVWADPKLPEMLKLLEIDTKPEDIFGSTLELGMLENLITTIKPRLLVEVGVFRGSTSIKMAQLLDRKPELKESFIISIDTWLLDLRFVWSAPTKEGAATGTQTRYFKNVYIGGASHMYYIFLSNVLFTRTQHRIIPLQTASSNGAMALIAHRLRPDLIYLDASHANPDVFVDLEHYYNVLAPGGALAMDDYEVAAVQTAVDALVRKHGLELQLFNKGTQADFAPFEQL
ncbi:hypothetical protein PTSG_04983 [Salpingoeca rosetta]|uniref:Uncharacterized protein n=1 Tax=Salpingoeca rosetta (strain ATCC 50818 / BSB-021) TaxID=946362 RepID=F2U966_SALR5|nr:uncharacterized protein PTSG_04983 [Salpingoeca rosetta]EGD73269.1 hypothetical protein PTSG_04983 [Salpingoeca rosetta]|eukprot:XP_004994300.1 hypothetical protein PTSG_04983 [Salpingoeca rosetta]